eukprot:Awhi_evm1s8425
MNEGIVSPILQIEISKQFEMEKDAEVADSENDANAEKVKKLHKENNSSVDSTYIINGENFEILESPKLNVCDEINEWFNTSNINQPHTEKQSCSEAHPFCIKNSHTLHDQFQLVNAVKEYIFMKDLQAAESFESALIVPSTNYTIDDKPTYIPDSPKVFQESSDHEAISASYFTNVSKLKEIQNLESIGNFNFQELQELLDVLTRDDNFEEEIDFDEALEMAKLIIEKNSALADPSVAKKDRKLSQISSPKIEKHEEELAPAIMVKNKASLVSKNEVHFEKILFSDEKEYQSPEKKSSLSPSSDPSFSKSEQQDGKLHPSTKKEKVKASVSSSKNEIHLEKIVSSEEKEHQSPEKKSCSSPSSGPSFSKREQQHGKLHPSTKKEGVKASVSSSKDETHLEKILSSEKKGHQSPKKKSCSSPSSGPSFTNSEKQDRKLHPSIKKGKDKASVSSSKNEIYIEKILPSEKKEHQSPKKKSCSSPLSGPSFSKSEQQDGKLHPSTKKEEIKASVSSGLPFPFNNGKDGKKSQRGEALSTFFTSSTRLFNPKIKKHGKSLRSSVKGKKAKAIVSSSPVNGKSAPNKPKSESKRRKHFLKRWLKLRQRKNKESKLKKFANDNGLSRKVQELVKLEKIKTDLSNGKLHPWHSSFERKSTPTMSDHKKVDEKKTSFDNNKTNDLSTTTARKKEPQKLKENHGDREIGKVSKVQPNRTMLEKNNEKNLPTELDNSWPKM